MFAVMLKVPPGRQARELPSARVPVCESPGGLGKVACVAEDGDGGAGGVVRSVDGDGAACRAVCVVSDGERRDLALRRMHDRHAHFVGI